MSEAFVDVSWRGLEVGKRIKLHAIHAGDAYLDHGTPMPVGTTLIIRTDDGLEIPVSVVRVHEQVGGSAEVPGMQIVPRALEGTAKAWWTERAEAPPVELVAEPAPAADEREEITSRPTLTMSTVEMERALAAAGVKRPETEPEPDASRTETMQAINPELLDGVPEPTGGDDGLVDDGRRTMAMSALDISAIVEAAETETSGAVDGNGNGDDDGPSGDGPSGDGPAGSSAGATSKKKRGGRGKNKRR